MSPSLPGFFPPPEAFVPNERALAALAKPLDAGLVLQPTSPPLRLDMLSPALDSRTSRSDTDMPARLVESPNPLRAANRALLGAARTRGGWRGISLHLIKGLQVGHGKYAQVWSAEVDVDGRKCGRVVVKLFAEALWPLPHDWHRFWRPLEERLESELQAYASLRPTQGRDVPHCYGAYEFEMPWGDIVVGVVLEDLGEVAESLVDFCRREQDGLLSDVSSAYDTALDVGEVEPRRDDVYVLRSSTALKPHIAFAGFSWAESAKEGRPAYAAEFPDHVYRWRDEDPLDRVWDTLTDYRLDWGGEVERREPGLIAWGGVRKPGLVEDLSEERASVFC
ncbi:hypothetical protein JCM9279_000548 [Rhodotorula babjevae]